MYLRQALAQVRHKDTVRSELDAENALAAALAAKTWKQSAPIRPRYVQSLRVSTATQLLGAALAAALLAFPVIVHLS